MITIFPFPGHIPFFMRTDSTIMPQIIRNLDDQIPEFQVLCIFRRNAGQPDLSAKDNAGNSAGEPSPCQISSDADHPMQSPFSYTP